MPNEHTKPGSHMDRVLALCPKAICEQRSQANKYPFIIRISRKSHMILGQGTNAQDAWRDAAKEINC